MHGLRVCLKMFTGLQLRFGRSNAQQRRAASSGVVEGIVLSTIMLMDLGDYFTELL